MLKEIVDIIVNSRLYKFIGELVTSVKNTFLGNETVAEAKDAVDNIVDGEDKEKTKATANNIAINTTVNRFANFIKTRKVNKVMNNKYIKGILKVGSVAATALGLMAVAYVAVKILPVVLSAIAVTLAVTLIVEVVLAIMNTAIPQK